MELSEIDTGNIRVCKKKVTNNKVVPPTTPKRSTDIFKRA